MFPCGIIPRTPYCAVCRRVITLQGSSEGSPLGQCSAVSSYTLLARSSVADTFSIMTDLAVLAQFMLTVWRRVFTPFQVAQITVQTYPGSADILAMIKCGCDARECVSEEKTVSWRLYVWSDL